MEFQPMMFSAMVILTGYVNEFKSSIHWLLLLEENQIGHWLYTDKYCQVSSDDFDESLNSRSVV